MKALTREWIEKAEGDFATALRERRARRAPNHDAACFHAQQCIEKYLKARLVQENIRFPRTHDLDCLLDLNLPLDPLWSAFRPMLVELTRFAVGVRYPGESATPEMARRAVADCKIIRTAIRDKLGLEE
jgi:HEPN domain-containing protein